MSDSINNNRTTEIRLSDDSTIDLNISIYINTDAVGCIANDRINSTQLSKTLALVEYMLITACQCSVEEMEEMQKKHGN
jgi:hypothetical protein